MAGFLLVGSVAMQDPELQPRNRLQPSHGDDINSPLSYLQSTCRTLVPCIHEPVSHCFNATLRLSK